MDLRAFIFSKGRKASIKRHLAVWIGAYAFLLFCYPPHGSLGAVGGIELEGITRYYRMASIRCFFHLFCQMFFCYPLLYYLVPVFLRQKKYALFTSMLLLLLAMTSLLRFALFTYVYNPIMRELKLHVNSPEDILHISFIHIFDGPACAGFLFIAFKLFKDWQQKQKDNLDLQKENANAELQLLKAQIHPHFLFNTLNNIYSFTLERSPQAKKMVKMLEDMLHYMIEECEHPLVPLTKEVDILNDYFELERIRYGNSIDMQVEITGDTAGKLIAPLLMIPFVENSFKHGTSQILREPWIHLFIQADDDVVHFSLTNSKPGEDTPRHRKGIGLYNVRKRLELLYPATHLLLIESTTNTFTVNMQIPISQP
jgi:sensor histidine kinase YesM